jgi:hypothetical protein
MGLNDNPVGFSTSHVVARILIAIVLIGAIIIGLYYAGALRRLTASPENIQRIGSDQLTQLIYRWSGPYGASKGLTEAVKDIPEDQRLLINTHVRTTRLCGYLGPFSNGVYDGTTATRLALNSGARCIIMEIDMDENQLPVLTYRDITGVRMALNSTTLSVVAKHIQEYGFSQGDQGCPADVANDPLILVLYFARAPSQADKPKAYLQFLGKVARELQPLRQSILAITPQGDYRRQGLESQLFFTPVSLLMGRVIIVTNADTSGFRNLSRVGLNEVLTEQDDLDLLVHARAYTPQSPSGLGITSQALTSVKPAVMLTTPYYWSATPPDRVVEQQTATKQFWTIAMEPVATSSNSPDAATLKKLYETYGVQSVPFVLFDAEETVRPFLEPYMKGTSWRAKPELIRFVPPAPIPVKKAQPETNARGGAIIPPTYA